LLEHIQIDLHNVLWGGGGTDDNDVFSSLTNLILAKIQDEDEKRNGETYDFQTLSFETQETLYSRINELYRKALKEKLNMTSNDQIEKSQVVDTNKFSLSKLKYTVQTLEKYSFVDGKNSVSGKDILGDFFEGIIRTGFKQSKGQFFTHVNIVKFMLWAIQTDKLAIKRINNDKEIPYMIDPSAGSGTFLIEYMKFITQNIKYRFRSKLDTNRAVKDKVESDWFYPDNKENKWAREYIYGSELNFNLGTATKVNMILHGDGSTNIFVGAQKGDGLLPFNEYIKSSAPNALNKEFEDIHYTQKVNGQFDIILTNPPFSVSLDNDTKKKVGKSFLFGDKKNSENLFIERYYQLLREGGRLAAVLPESVFDTTENKYIRLFLYKYFIVKAIVSLPQKTFAPFTNTKTSILFAKKKSEAEVGEWEKTWNKYAKEYSQIKTRVENLVAVWEGKKNKNSLPSIKGLEISQERELLDRFLKVYLQAEDIELSNT
ncbi:HsdM family class I SAM-dependent methyltransferase, partial [Enterocloster citroniae]